MQICHVPPGNPGNSHTICIRPDDLSNHLSHGDFLGSCGAAKWSGFSQDNNDVISDEDNSNDESDLKDFENRHSLQNTTTIFPNPNPGQFTLLMLPDVVKTQTSVY
ncbi:MAG: hypothetical protein IH784_09150, partial [Bacteroidetes bacterium]|nr:hypothetical protein [Bacteroidota bacterium]